MSIRTLLTTLYWTAISAFLAGAGLRIVGGEAGIAELDDVGQIVCMSAWVLAVVAAIVDVRVRSRRTPVAAPEDEAA